MSYIKNIHIRFLAIILVLKYVVLIQGESVDSECSAFDESVECNEVTYTNSYQNIGIITNIRNAFEEKNVEYWIYTRERRKGQRFDRNSQYMVESTTFNNTKPTKVMVHGWMGETIAEESLCLNTKDNYLSVGDYNIICVKWTVLILDVNYANAVLRVKPIGNDVAEFIKKLTMNTKDGVKNFHLVGHSLGAHIVGFAGKNLNGQIPRITGLDPAKPLYELAFSNYRIADTDAKFVDIIHTNGGKLGLDKPLGNIDFYPNGGKWQPQCLLNIIGKCNHLKAIHYFAYSIIDRDDFESIQCSSWKAFKKDQCKVFGQTTYMGEYVDQKKTGKYYLKLTGSYQ